MGAERALAFVYLFGCHARKTDLFINWREDNEGHRASPITRSNEDCEGLQRVPCSSNREVLGIP